MDSVLYNFNNEIGLIKRYIHYQDINYKEQFKNNNSKGNSLLEGLTRAKIKQYNYSSYIIFIFGAYEQFIEELLAKYLSKISEISDTYEELPEAIQKNNVEKAFKIIQQKDYLKHKDVEPAEVIAALHKNINEGSPEINADAFKNHNANFRIRVVDAYFYHVGLTGIKNNLIKYEPLKSIATNFNRNIENVKPEVLYSKLEELCDTRNLIAHGESDFEIKDESVLVEYIDFIQAFSEALYKLVYDNYLKYVYDKKAKEIEVIEVFDKKRVIGINTRGLQINNESIILVKSEKEYPNYCIAIIRGIEENRNSIGFKDIKEDSKITIKLDIPIKKNMNFRIITE